LEEAHAMGDDARLPARRACRASAAGVAAGAEDAGLAHLVALVDQERSGAANDRNLCTSGSVHSATTPSPARLRDFAAARATALVEQIRSYKLVRDIRDLLAADQLETATYDLLARAAERAGDPDTANLAQQLGASERTAARPPHRRTRRRAGDRAPRRVTASPDAA
jgi:hypothetical protein